MSAPVTNTNGTQGAKAVSAVPPNPKGEMGDDAFMKLLVAELKQQDPTDPMQARDMVAQLAQLSSVQKLTTIDKQLGALNDGSLASASMQSAGLIGRTVTASTNNLVLTSTENPSGSFSLAAPADTVSVEVLSASGEIVQKLDLGTKKLGNQNFSWDGRNADGTRVPNGTYTFKVTARDAGGQPVAASTEIKGIVSEVMYENGAPAVVVGGARVSLGDVTRVAQ